MNQTVDWQLAEDVLFVVNTTAMNLIGGNLVLNVHLVSTEELIMKKISKHLQLSKIQKSFSGDKIKFL